MEPDKDLQYDSLSKHEKEKYIAAAASLDYVQPGMTVGLGSGSTANYAIQLLGRKVAGGLDIVAVSSSQKSSQLAKENGIRLLPMDGIDAIDLYIDGADEVDCRLNLIKGGGGALLGEKIVAETAGKVIIIVDARKMVESLGEFPVPVEVIPFSKAIVSKRVSELGGTPMLRKSKDHGTEPFFTSEGNLILDCKFSSIDCPETLGHALERIPGVVVQGICLDMADIVIVGRGESFEVIERK